MIPQQHIITIEEPNTATILKSASSEVTFPLKKDDLNLIRFMKDKLHELHGVGLAAPQVGINKRIIAIYIPEDAALLRENVKPYPLHVLINPSYQIAPHTEKVADFEACYSVASKAGKVPRYKIIQLTYQNELGEKITTTESGFYARVLQHEIDHLNGILITDHLTPDCLQGSMDEMMAIRRQELSTEKQKLFDKLIRGKRLKSSK